MNALYLAPVLVVNILTLARYDFDGSKPEEFVRELYAPYIRNDHAYVQSKQDLSRKFDSCLGSLLERDNQQPIGDVGYLDADPVCGCQDFSNFGDLNVVEVEKKPRTPRWLLLFAISRKRTR